MNESGVCCNEMDIWEANGRATVLTPHTCSGTGSFLCAGDDCGEAGVCDKPGCGLNPYRAGATSFYGPDMDVDTSRPFTVVTQFLSDDGTDEGVLSEIRRVYVQDGRVIENAPGEEGGEEPGAVTGDFCEENGAENFLRLGGLQTMGESLQRGMVLIFSIWNSEEDFMEWLDAGEAGPCGETEGDPAVILEERPDVSVTFSNVKIGEIGSTFDAEGGEGLTGAAAEGEEAQEQEESRAGKLGSSVVGAAALAAGFFAFL